MTIKLKTYINTIERFCISRTTKENIQTNANVLYKYTTVFEINYSFVIQIAVTVFDTNVDWLDLTVSNHHSSYPEHADIAHKEHVFIYFGLDIYNTSTLNTYKYNYELQYEDLIPVPICPPQILHGLTRDRVRASVVRGRRLTS
jgi:hypothetical protein